MFVLPGTIPFLRISGDSQGFFFVLISGSTAPSAGMEQGKKTSGLPVSLWCHRVRSWKWGCDVSLCETFVNGGWPRHFYPLRKNVNILGVGGFESHQHGFAENYTRYKVMDPSRLLINHAKSVANLVLQETWIQVQGADNISYCGCVAGALRWYEWLSQRGNEYCETGDRRS